MDPAAAALRGGGQENDSGGGAGSGVDSQQHLRTCHSGHKIQIESDVLGLPASRKDGHLPYKL